MVAADHPRTMLWPQVLWRLLGGPSADLQNHAFATLEGIGGRRRRSCRCEGKGPRLQLYADGSRRGVSANDQHDGRMGAQVGTGADWSRRSRFEATDMGNTPAHRWEDITAQEFVLRFDFRGIPKGSRNPRHWWLLIRQDEIEVCLKDPGQNLDVMIEADLAAFTKVWTGYCRLEEALARGQVTFRGADSAIAQMRRMLKLTDETVVRNRGALRPKVAAD